VLQILADNKEWLFQGAGIVLCGIMVRVSMRVLANMKERKAKDESRPLKAACVGWELPDPALKRIFSRR